MEEIKKPQKPKNNKSNNQTWLGIELLQTG